MDAEPLTALRTAASATIAMQCLAPPSVQRIAIIGSGAQARAQLRYLALSGTPADVVIASRNPEHARRAAAEHPSARALDSVREAVDGAEIVLCCTDAASPVVQDSWLARGAHLSSVGGSHGPEIDRESIERGALFVEWGGRPRNPRRQARTSCREFPLPASRSSEGCWTAARGLATVRTSLSSSRPDRPLSTSLRRSLRIAGRQSTVSANASACDSAGRDPGGTRRTPEPGGVGPPREDT